LDGLDTPLTLQKLKRYIRDASYNTSPNIEQFLLVTSNNSFWGYTGFLNIFPSSNTVFGKQEFLFSRIHVTADIKRFFEHFYFILVLLGFKHLRSYGLIETSKWNLRSFAGAFSSSRAVKFLDLGRARHVRLLTYGRDYFLRYLRKFNDFDIFIEDFNLKVFRKLITKSMIFGDFTNAFFLESSVQEQFRRGEQLYDDYIEMNYLREINLFVHANSLQKNLRKTVLNHLEFGITDALADESSRTSFSNYHGLFVRENYQDLYFESEDMQTPDMEDLPLANYDESRYLYDELEDDEVDIADEDVFFFEDGYLHYGIEGLRRLLNDMFYEAYYIYEDDDDEGDPLFGTQPNEDDALPIGDSRIHPLPSEEELEDEMYPDEQPEEVDVLEAENEDISEDGEKRDPFSSPKPLLPDDNASLLYLEDPIPIRPEDYPDLYFKLKPLPVEDGDERPRRVKRHQANLHYYYDVVGGGDIFAKAQEEKEEEQEEQKEEYVEEDKDDDEYSDHKDGGDDDDEYNQDDNDDDLYRDPRDDEDDDEDEYDEDDDEDNEDVPPEVYMEDFFTLQGMEYDYTERSSLSTDYSQVLGLEYSSPLSYTEKMFDTVYDDFADFH